MGKTLLSAEEERGVINLRLVMKGEVSRSSLHTPDNSLPRSEILRGRRNFDRLFEKSIVLNSESLQFRFRLYKNPAEGCALGFIVPKKKIKSAVKRNRLKRLMRESYRMNQHLLKDSISEKEIGFHGALMAGNDNLSYNEINKQVIELLQKTSVYLARVSSSKTDEPPSSPDYEN